jgi:RHS repeat-associated protein
LIINSENIASKQAPVWEWQYNLTDHLGNVRVVLTGSNPNSATIIQENHYYPFGMLMADIGSTYPDYNPENVTQPYLYNGKEYYPELELNWYDYGARFYDPSLGRWHSVDPRAEKYYNLSPYNYCANNPIRYTDPNGDTINTDALMDNEMAYRAYQTFVNSKEGAAFVKLFEAGGEFGKVMVMFGIDTEKTEGANGDTRIYADGKEVPFGAKIGSEQKLSFEVNINPGTMFQEGLSTSSGKLTKESASKSNYQRTLNKAHTILHESQHVEIMTRDAKTYGKYIRHPYWQHDLMKDTQSKYYKARVDFYQKQNIYNLPYDPNGFEN